ncbi:MAG: hypothetical protein NWF05_06510 [Candidatus Bathyarchaeota archaeon]|nr:hypothetical protein [Candidatus Bathyarchaeota archaeon]
MLTPAAVVYVYPYKLLVAPALVIVLAATLTFLVKFPSMKRHVGAVLIALGVFEAFGSLPLMFFEGYIIGLATLTVGVALVANAVQMNQPVHLSKQSRFSPRTAVSVAFLAMGSAGVFAGGFARSFWVVALGIGALIIGTTMGLNVLSVFMRQNAVRKTRVKLRRAAYLVLAGVMLTSGMLITLRATNVLHEQRLENWGVSTVNLTVQGTVSEVKYNHEINNGYSYHIFPAYVTLNVTRLIWGDASGSNQTSAAEYWQNRTVAVGYDKTSPPQLIAGQQIEVNGYFCGWIEDSLYSNKLIVTSNMNEGYIKKM